MTQRSTQSRAAMTQESRHAEHTEREERACGIKGRPEIGREPHSFLTAGGIYAKDYYPGWFQFRLGGLSESELFHSLRICSS